MSPFASAWRSPLLTAGPAEPTRLNASIELSVRQALKEPDLPGMVPAGVRVYIPDMGSDDVDTLVRAARRIRDLGYMPVPHFAARRVPDRPALENRLAALAGEAGVDDALIIGGGLDKPVGTFSSSMEMLETGLFDRYGMKKIGVAGHPEGSPDFSEAVAVETLRLKRDFGERTGAQLRLVTQFGFDGLQFAKWADGLPAYGIDMPVHIGVAGPARLPTLIRYATMCGVGNSLSFLKRRGSAVASLVSGFSPEEMVAPIEAHLRSVSSSPIRQIHVFPFGGIKATTAWLTERGSWPSIAQERAGG